MGKPERVQFSHCLEQLEDHVGQFLASGILPHCIKEREGFVGGEVIVLVRYVAEALECLNVFTIIFFRNDLDEILNNLA